MTEFNQGAPPHGSMAYGRALNEEEVAAGEHKRTVTTSACYAVSIAMILNYYQQSDSSLNSGVEITPSTVMEWYDSTKTVSGGREAKHYYISNSWDPRESRIKSDFPDRWNGVCGHSPSWRGISYEK